MNYLELTNEAIREAGISLARLTQTDFASPDQEMQERFKGWVARSWRELQISRENWSFMAKRAGGSLFPRLYIENGNLPAEPSPGDLFTGVDNGSTFSVVSVTTVEGDWTLGTAKAYIEIDELDGELEYGEAFDRVSSPSATNAFTYGGRGRWDLRDLASDFDTLDYNALYITNTDTGTSDYTYQLRFLEWNVWNDYREGTFNELDRPAEFTETPDRLVDFYPSPDKEYRIYFNYKRRLVDLVNFDDEPDLDSQYHELLVWMAVMAYADWDEKPGVYRYAEKNMRKWRTRVENKYLPKLGWGKNMYDRS